MTDTDAQSLVARLRAGPKGWVAPDPDAHRDRERTKALMREAADALDQHGSEFAYALRLAKSLHAKHFSDVPQWRPLDDLTGLLTQIDNMACGISAAAETRGLMRAAEIARKFAGDARRHVDATEIRHWSVVAQAASDVAHNIEVAAASQPAAQAAPRVVDHPEADIFDRLHIKQMTEEWFNAPGCPPSRVVEGYLEILRKRLARWPLVPRDGEKA